jgi:hypothetical protein
MMGRHVEWYLHCVIFHKASIFINVAVISRVLFMINVTGSRSKALLRERCFLNSVHRTPASDRHFRDQALLREVISSAEMTSQKQEAFPGVPLLTQLPFRSWYFYTQKNKIPFALLWSLIQSSLASWGNEPLNYILQRKALANSFIFCEKDRREKHQSGEVVKPT